MKVNEKRHREFHIDTPTEADDHGDYITLSLSSEFPAPSGPDGAYEVLLHGPDNIDMTRAGKPQGLPLLILHNKNQLPTGRLKNVRIENRKLKSDAYFSSSALAQQIRSDVAAGIITDTSIGYQVKGFKRVPGRNGEPDTYNVHRWLPYEGSLVGLAEDPDVGYGRAMGGPVEDGTEDPTTSNPVLSSTEVAEGLGNGSDNPGPEIGEARCEGDRELGLIDGILDAAGDAANDSSTANMDPAAAGVDGPGTPAAATSEASTPVAELHTPDDDGQLFYQRDASFAGHEEDPDTDEETRAAKEPYGDVEYADPGYQADHQKRYPIDTKDHAKAANSYIHMKKNAAKYSPADLHKVVAKIEAALKAFGVDEARALEAGETRCDDGERMQGGDKPAPVPAELPDPQGGLSLPPGSPDPDNPVPGGPDPTDDQAVGADRTRAMAGNPDVLGDPEVCALRRIALHYRSAAEVDSILRTRSLAEARPLLLTPLPPPEQSVRVERFHQGKSLMLNLNLATRAMGECVKGNFNILDADDSSVKEVIQRTGERQFKVDLFNEALGGNDYSAARDRFLAGSQRDMTTVATSNGGGQAVSPVPIGFIDWLFARTALLKAGASIKTGVGSLFYLKIQAAAAATAQNEDSTAPAATAPGLERVAYVPHMMVAKIPLTEELQKESVFDLQPILRQHVSKLFAVTMDAAGINGNATYTSPIAGILTSGNSTQMNLTTAGVPAAADVLALKGQVDLVAVDLDTCSYITHPKLFTKLEATPRLASGLTPLADRNQIDGYRAFTTANLAPTGSDYTLLFGDFSECEFCFQGPLEVVVDQITQAAQGITNLIFRQYYDFGVKQPVAFAYCANYTLS